ncbi:MAG: hypothetical protein LBH58_03215 [Tannerellaceae bacterium]|jgi:hypothetical protein|nr:hypothetical protein [Tannerellaceae bacterium]
MKSIKFLIISLFTGILLCSCEQEAGTVYTGELDNLVSFDSPKYTQELAEEDGTQIKIKLQRAQTSGTLDVPIIFESKSDLIQMNDLVVHFADGEAVAYGVVSHPGASGLDIGIEYQATLEIDEEVVSVSPGGVSKQQVTLTKKLTWKSVGEGTFTSNDIYEDTYPVKVLSTEEDPNIYKALGLYKDGYDILIIVDKTKKTAVIPQQEIGLSLFGDDYPGTWLRADACTYDNGVITITPGSDTNYNKWLVGAAQDALGVYVSSPEILVLPQGSY